MSETMIERVARALCARLGVDPDQMVPSIVVNDLGRPMGMSASFSGPMQPQWMRWEGEARATMVAMREPTEAMLRDPTVITGRDSEGFGISEGDAREVWQAMIDTALNEKSTEKTSKTQAKTTV